MIRHLISLLILCTLAAAADTNGPLPGSTMLLTDGANIYPTNATVTPTQLRQLSDAIDPLVAESAEARTASTNAAAIAARAYDSIRFIDQQSIVSSTAYIGSVGAKASAGTNQTIVIHSWARQGDPVTNLHFVAVFNKVQTVAPALNFRASLVSNAVAPSAWAMTNAACSWPDTVVDNTVTNAGFIYSFDMPLRSLGTSGFIQVVSRDDGGSGSGYYFLVYNFISVNGRVGATTDVVDDFNHTWHYEGGVLSLPLEN